ncbi:hypothetical protein [Nonomuraea indica]|uniref:hypothetical protein n=1 Tax=Nonomuraea indica TaxID=1581193 RepID=UPI000C7AD781|nr:hypothetical protein [Nonomuraea indica]
MASIYGTATPARLQTALACAAVLLGCEALTEWTAFMWLLHEAGLPWQPWAWLPAAAIASACWHVAIRLWRTGTIPTVSALCAGAGWVLLIALNAAFWLR